MSGLQLPVTRTVAQPPILIQPATVATVQVPEENICYDYRKYYLLPITFILIGLFICCIIVCSQLPEKKQKEKDNIIKFTYSLSSIGLCLSLSLLFIMIFKCNPEYNGAVGLLTLYMGLFFFITCIIFISLFTT